MLELFGLLVAFVIIFILRFRGFDFATTIFIAATMVGVTCGKPLTIFINVAIITIQDTKTWELCAAVATITVLGYALKETGHMMELIDRLRSFLPSRFLLALIPALLGILSMPGGALMSAPFNEPEADRIKLKPEQKSFINIWFRHVWYWASPISPSTILATSLTGIALNQFIAINFPVFLSSWIIGLIIYFRWGGKDVKETQRICDYKGSLVGLSPILSTIVLTLIMVPVWVAVNFGIALLIIIKKVDLSEAISFFRKGIKWDIVAAVFATLYFRYMMVASGSVKILLENILGYGIPLLLLLVIIPILVGMISANPTMGIGISFPLLLPLISNINVYILSVIFTGLVSGYNGSPLHLCLILTNQYYRSDLFKVYRLLIPPIIVLFFLTLTYHIVLSGFWATSLFSAT